MTKVKIPIEVGVAHVNEAWWYVKLKRKVVKDMYVIGFYMRSTPCQASIVVLDDKSPETIHNAIVENLSNGSLLYAEEWILPQTLSENYEILEIPKSAKVGSSKEHHINHVNSMWRDLKRTIKDEHIQVSKKHLQLYCDEISWRVNHAHLSPFDRFELLIKKSAQVGHLKYKDLTTPD